MSLPFVLLLVSLGALLGVLAGWQLQAARVAAAMQAARVEARRDALTGLANRRAFDERLAAQHAQAARYGHGYALVLLDLDGFKNVNDSEGHAAGDEVLRQFAAKLRSQVREADLPARYGGDEFAVLCPFTDLAGAATLADRLRTALIIERRGDATVQASYGTSAWQAGDSPESILARADASLRSAKLRVDRN